MVQDDSSLLQAFEADGFLVARDILPKHCVDELRAFIEGAFEDCSTRFYASTGFTIADREAVDYLIDKTASDPARYAALPILVRSLLRNELPLEVRLAPELRVVPDQFALRALVANLLSAEAVHVHNPPTIRVSTPGSAKSGVPLHQDIAYAQHVSKYVTAWIPLTSIDDLCGGVDLMTGSHRIGSSLYTQSNIWLNLTSLPPMLGQLAVEHPHMSIGDALIFNQRLYHRSHQNRSTRVRHSVDYRLHSSKLKSTKHVYDPATRVVLTPQADLVLALPDADSEDNRRPPFLK